MNKKSFFIGVCVIILTLIMSVAFVACAKPNKGDDYDGNMMVTREVAEEILSKVDFGDQVYCTANSLEYGYSINSGGFVVYQKDLNHNGDEIYYGGWGEDWYKVMISNQERSYTRVAKWEAMQVLEETKAEMTQFFTVFNSGDFDMTLQQQREYGGDFGALTVSGNVYKERAEDTIPQSGSIVYSINMIQGIAASMELEFMFTDKKVTEIFTRFNELEGYVPDNVRDSRFQGDGYSFEYNRTLAMPADKGNDVTQPQNTLNVYRIGCSLPVLYNQTKGANITLGTPEDAGTFLGWYYDKDYKFPVEGQYKVGFERDYEVYAKWQVPAIQTQLNGGVFAEGSQSSLSRCIYLRDIREIVPYKKGYGFDGWYKEGTFENKVEYDDYTQITASTTAHAKWTPLVKITLSADISYALPKLIGTEGDNMGLDYVTPVKRGGVFAGWFKDRGFQNPVTEAYFPATNATYYAKFDNSICVDINFDNASLTIAIDKYINIPLASSEEYDFAELIADLKTNEYAGGHNADNQTFTGWYTDSTFSHPLKAYPTSNITVYPKVALRYFYIIDAGQGTLTDYYFNEEFRCINGMKAKLIPVAESLAEMANSDLALIAAPEGKQFSGWYSDVALTTPYQPSAYPTQDTKIYAKYENIT